MNINFLKNQTLKFLIVLFPVIFFSSCSCSQKPKCSIKKTNVSEITYVFSPDFSEPGNKAKLNVDLYITLKTLPTKNDTLFLALPNNFGGAKELYNNIENLTVQGATIYDENEPWCKKLTHFSTNVVHINYQVICSVKYLSTLVGKKDHYSPILTKEYFHLIGKNCIVYPHWDNEKISDISGLQDKFNITLKWENFPESWQLANSYGVNEKEQHLQLSIPLLRQSVYVAGDYKINKLECMGKPFFTAARGELPFNDNELATLVESIIKTQRNFWKDYDFPYYIITAISIGDQKSFGGTCLNNAFSLFLGTKNFSMKRLAGLLSHEHFHTWNGHKILTKEPEKLVYWFSEGFTEYYAQLLLLRADNTTIEEFVESYNNMLYKLYTSPVKNEPNERILKDMRNNYDIEKLPYFRGEVLAHNWDTQIKLATNGKHSLDDLMFDILREAVEKGEASCAELINRLSKKYLLTGLEEEIEKHVNAGQTIIPHEKALGPCCTLEWQKMKNATLGGKPKIENGKHLVDSLDPTGAAYKAGLRNGQIILESNIPFVLKPDFLIKLKIQDLDGSIKNIEFYPAGDQEFDVPQYVLHKDILEKKQNECRKWFGIK